MSVRKSNNNNNYPRNAKVARKIRDGVYSTVMPQSATIRTQEYPRFVSLENIATKMTSLVNQAEKKHSDVQLGPVSSLQEVIVTTNSAPSTLHAIKKRLDVVPPDGVGEDFKTGHGWLMSITPPMKEIRADEACINEWLSTLSPAKQGECKKVLQEHLYWQGADDREIFAKSEILLKQEGSAPRMIHNGNPVVNVIAGAVTNELQKRAALVLSERNPGQDPNHLLVVFPSGKDDKETAELRSRLFQGEGQVIEGDFSSNDATQPGDIRKYEALWYRKLGAPDWYVRYSLDLVSMNVFSRQLGLKAVIEGQRHSGEEAGTIGNTYNATCVLAGASLAVNGRGNKILVYGDDSLMWVPQQTLGDAQEIRTACVEGAANHGMTLETAMPPKELATFLQTRVYESQGSGAVPIPKLGRYLSKINVRANNNPDVSNKDYLAGKYIGLAHQTRYLPSISRKLLSTAQSLSVTPFIERAHKAWKPVTDPLTLIRSVTDVKYPLSRSEEAQAIAQIYQIDLGDLEATVDLFCAGAIYQQGGTGPGQGALGKALAASRGINILGDVDNPTMARLIRVDNGDQISA